MFYLFFVHVNPLHQFRKAFIILRIFVDAIGIQVADKLVVTSLKRQANLIILVQITSVVILAAVFLLITGYRAALATLCGGLVYILPGYFYAGRLLSNVSSRAVMRIMMVFYLGEALKLLVTVGLFVLLFYMFSFSLLPYFLGYLSAALAFCIAPMFFLNNVK